MASTLISGSKGNKTESAGPLGWFLGISLITATANVYFLRLQVYVYVSFQLRFGRLGSVPMMGLRYTIAIVRVEAGSDRSCGDSTRIDIALNAVALGFIGLEFLIALYAMFRFSRATA